MSGTRSTAERLHALHDGELAGLSGWWARVWLRRSREARRELESLALVGELVREVEDAAVSSPDLWPAIAPRIRAIDANTNVVRAAAPADEARPVGLRWLLRPVGAAAVVAAAVALALALRPTQVPEAGGLRALQTYGKPVIVLEGEGGATIIWLIDTVPEDVSGSAVQGGALGAA